MSATRDVCRTHTTYDVCTKSEENLGGLFLVFADLQLIIHLVCIVLVSRDMMRSMVMSYKDYTHTSTLRISVGTWNVNGGKHFRSIAFKHEHITDWLLDLPKIKPPAKQGSENH